MGATLLVPTEQHLDVEIPARGDVARGRTFRAFVSGLATRVAPDLGLASPHATRLLCRAAIARVAAPAEDGNGGSGASTGPGRPRLRFPEEPAARVALAHAIDRAIGRLRRAGTSAAHLDAAGTRAALLLADILRDVDGHLAAARLTDDRGAAGLAASRLTRVDARGALADLDGAVTVTGMTALEPDDLALLEAVHGALRTAGGAGVTLELPRLSGPVERAFDDAIAKVADAIERRWASLPDAPEIAWRPARTGAPKLVVAAVDAEGESRAAAAKVLEALDRGTALDRIAIVVPDLDETRLEPLRARLGDARVPFREPRGRAVASCPEATVALGLLAMAAGPVTRDQAIELLRAPGVHPGSWMERAGPGEATRRAVTLAHRLREVPVEVDRTGRLLVDALTDATRERPDEAWMPRALERMLKEARWVGSAGDARDARDDARAPRHEVARRLLAVLDRLGLGRPTVREIGAALAAEGKGSETVAATLALRALGDSAAAVRALREALRAIVEGAALAGLAAEPVSAVELAAELSASVAELGIGLGVEGGGVRIARPGELAGLEHDLVIVTGLASGAYGGVEGELALLDERVRRLLPAACRPPSAREREAWQKAELAWAMAGSEEVVLSYAAGEEADRAPPHELVRWAMDHGAGSHREPASRVAPSASRTDARSAELGVLAAGAPPQGEVLERVAAERARTVFFLDPRTPSAAHTGRVALADEPARARLLAAVGGDAPERPVAVTAIERAAGCGFVGFARRVLRVRRVDDLAESADARERGTLIHRALFAAFEGARDAPSRAEALTRGRAAAERELGIGTAMAPLRREAVLAAVADAMDLLERSFEPGSPFRFFAAEQRFGPVYERAAERAPPRGRQRAESLAALLAGDAPSTRGGWPALAIEGDEAGGPVVHVDGQIDRVDLTPDRRRARVVDYKTGRLPSADEHGKRAFQLPLYTAVVAEVLGCDEVEAVYVSLKPRGLVDEWPRGDEDRRILGARRREIALAARQVVLRLWEGDVAPRPAKAALCTRCEARDVCRRPAVAPIEESDEK